MRKVAGYVRVSSVGGREGASFQSPCEQEKAIRAHCKTHRLELVEVAHELDASGGTMKRAQLQRLIGEVEAGRLEGIVVARLDRFARTLVGGVQALERIGEAGGFVQAADGSLDTLAGGSALATMQQNFMLTLAQWERSSRAEGLESAKQNAVARGVHISGRVPAGYLRAGKGAALTLDKAKAAAIRAAFELRATGAPIADVVRLLERRIPGGPAGQGRWTRETVTRLLGNRVYVGEARQGSHVQPDAHLPITSQEVFDTVQALGRRVERATPSTARSLLAGVVRCGSCGHALERNTVGGGYKVYRCRGRSAEGICEAPASAMADALETVATDAVLARLDAAPVEPVAPDVDLADLHGRIAAARAKRAPFEDPDYVAALGVDAARRALGRVDEEIAALEDELADAVTPAGEEAPFAISNARELWPTLDTDERRQIIGAMIDALTVSRGLVRRGPLVDRTAITWKGEGAPISRPTRGRRNRPEIEARMAAA
jgi:DNA invertase Pin-like site-specific DNA recombinase